MATIKRECRTCSFWAERKMVAGECRRHPPIVGVDPFPIVTADSWCGEYREAGSVEYPPNGTQVTRLEYRPGDTIVVKCKDHISDYARSSTGKLLDGLFPDCRTLLLDGGVDVSVIGAADETTRTNASNHN